MKKLWCLLTLLTIVYALSYSDTHTSVLVGNWSDPRIWDNGVPDLGDDVIINSSVILDISTVIINSLTINIGASLLCKGAAIVMNDPETGAPIVTYTYTTISIAIGGSFTNNGTFDHNYNNGVVFAGSGAVSGVVTFHRLSLTVL
jgi:hypothetical protein